MAQILLIAAAKFEAQPTLNLLKNNNIELTFIECGIGAIAAAKNAAIVAQASSGKHVVFIGSCGSFKKIGKIDNENIKIISATHIEWMPVGVRENQAELIESAYPPISIPSQNTASSAPINILCSSSITVADNTALPSRLTAEDTYENLELYSVASEIIESAETYQTFLAVTNQVGSMGRKQWQESHQAAAHHTAKIVFDYIQQINDK